jgi:predicted metal-dependent HD superfamily phosphohydrolase
MIGKSLEAAFQKIVDNQSINEDAKRTQDLAVHWWQTIVSAYSEPQRHYHTVGHIESMWKALETIPEDQISDRDAVVLAILFHECVARSSMAQR